MWWALINIIGSNLKGAVTSGIALSSQSVAEDAASCAVAGTEHQVAFRRSEGIFWVGLLVALSGVMTPALVRAGVDADLSGHRASTT